MRILIAGAVVLAWLVWTDRPGRGRLQRVASAHKVPPWIRRWSLRLVIALGVGLLLGGPIGLCAAISVAAVFPVLVRRIESRSDRQRRRDLMRQAPEIIDLLTACVCVGAPLSRAIDAVSTAISEPGSSVLRSVSSTLALGGDPAQAWRALAREPGMESLGKALSRSVASGAPLAGILPGIADDLRREQRAAVDEAARAAGVRAVLPLAACFLPAFILLGVVPVVASLATSVLHF